MKVVRDHHRTYREEPRELFDHLLEEGARARRIEVADVLREEGLPSPGDAHGALLMGAHTHDASAAVREGDRARDHTARPANRLAGTGHDTHDGVVGPRMNGAIMDEEGVRHVRESAERLGIILGDGLIGAISAGDDEERRPGPQEEVVERRGWEEDTELAEPGCHGGSDCSTSPHG